MIAATPKQYSINLVEVALSQYCCNSHAVKMVSETFILNPIFITNIVKKLLVELKYKTKDNLMPN